jgi:hypothetical protein
LEHGHESGRTAAQERLATGQAYLLESEASYENGSQMMEFL